MAVLPSPIAVNASFTLGLPPVLQAHSFLAGMLVIAVTMHRTLFAQLRAG